MKHKSPCAESSVKKGREETACLIRNQCQSPILAAKYCNNKSYSMVSSQKQIFKFDLANQVFKHTVLS